MKKIAALIFCLWFIFFFIQTKLVFAQDVCTDHHVDPEQNYPVNHPDVNLDVRNHFVISGKKELLNLNHPIDQGAPQLTTLIRDNPRPAITSLQQMCDWDWDNNVRRGIATTPPDVEYQLGGDFATLVGFQTNTGQEILVPDSGYDIGGGCEVLVLYATENSITIKYTADDDMVSGYGIHLENFQVDPAILKMYQELTTGAIDRPTLPALGAGQKLGTALAGEIRVAVRDTGSFMDPRWQKDWWINSTPATTNSQCPLTSVRIQQAGGKVLAKNTQIRADWIQEVYHKATTKRPNPSAEPETTVDPIGDSGELIVGPEGSLPSMPGLTQMTNSFVNAFKSLLPANRAAKASLPKSTTKTNTTSYVFPLKTDNTIDTNKTIHCDDGGPTEKDDVAKHTIKLNNDWSKLVGAFTGVAGMVLPIAQVDPSLYESFRYQMPKLDWKCQLYKFLYSRVVATQNMSDPNNDIKRTFRAPGLLEQIVEVIDEAVHKLLGIKAKVSVKVGAELPGGGYANQKSQEVNSAFSTAQRVDDFRAKGRVQSLDGILPTEVRLSPGDPSDNQLSFAGQLQTRDSACNTLCSAFPDKRIEQGTSWAGDDKICPKCDPKNYIIPDPPLPKPSDAPPWCMWDGFGCNFGCDVGKPLPDNPSVICTLDMMEGCGPGQDPVCESGRCNPNELGPRKDYNNANGKCPQGWTFKNKDGNLAEDCWEVCTKYRFSANETGGYGKCHYQNAEVCLRNDGAGGCGGVCNWVCCPGESVPGN